MAQRTRSKQVSFRMNEAEYALYLERLNQSKLSANEFGIRCLLNQPINVVENMQEILRQLKGIGNNLNQLARARNSNQVEPIQSVDELEKGVKEFWQLLKQSRGVENR